VEDEYPNILFAIDGEIYDLGGRQCIAIGRAYSVDKFYRLARGWGWWDDEQPSEAIRQYVEKQLADNGNRVDVVLSHTCPLKYEPKEVFLSFIDQSSVDKSTEAWLDTIEEGVSYDKWYCGHYHTQKMVDKVQFLFGSILRF
jgi:3-oxoacid CoA-transferase subunit A